MRYWLLLVFAYFLLLKGRQLPYPLNIPVFPYTQVTAWTGAILCSLGLVFCIWARVTLGRNWSGTITLKADHELIERGPYRIVRHPIYSGLLAMFVATAIAEGHLGEMIGVVLAFVSFWIKLGDEEKLMLEHFPQQYATYQQRVKRIIPFVL
jgi:protein-S-isoprenylcysteine O-methyltransferase Ste14